MVDREHAEMVKKWEKQRADVEEESFIRMTMTKKERSKLKPKRVSAMEALDDFGDVPDMSILANSTDEGMPQLELVKKRSFAQVRLTA